MRLGEAARALRERSFPVRWVPPENVHLTLKFLGEVPDERVPDLAPAVDGVAAGLAAFDMVITDFGAFPSLRRPQVVWVGVELSPTLGALQMGIEDAMARLGFPKEKRPFHPHLTLGRAHKRASAADFRGLAELVEQLAYSDSFRVGSVDVMKSRLAPSGAQYEVVHSAEFTS